MILTPSQTLDIFHRRVSTRYYDPARTISADDFAAILECGRLSPSSVGSEPWRFIVVQNRALRDKLKPVAWGMQTTLDDASHVVIILAKKHARYDSAFLMPSSRSAAATTPKRNASISATAISRQTTCASPTMNAPSLTGPANRPISPSPT